MSENLCFTSKQEELFKELERFYLRFGIKSLLLLLQSSNNSSSCTKRRETYVDSTNDLQIVDAILEEISFEPTRMPKRNQYT